MMTEVGVLMARITRGVPRRADEVLPGGQGAEREKEEALFKGQLSIGKCGCNRGGEIQSEIPE